MLGLLNAEIMEGYWEKRSDIIRNVLKR